MISDAAMPGSGGERFAALLDMLALLTLAAPLAPSCGRVAAPFECVTIAAVHEASHYTYLD